MPGSQTFSCGLALWNREEGIDELLRRVDTALYRAKELGRNRTIVADSGPVSGATSFARPTPLENR
jgi:PleD family two-component response regulator